MKKVLIFYDVVGWAWHSRALDLKKYAPAHYDVHIHPEGAYPGLIKDINSGIFDGVFFFSWSWNKGHSGIRVGSLLSANGCMYECWDGIEDGSSDTTKENWLAVGATKSRRLERAKQHFPNHNFMICLNKRLVDFAQTLNQNAVRIPTGIDQEIFIKKTMPGNDLGKLKVGLCGQLGRPGVLNEKSHTWIADRVISNCSEFCDFSVNRNGHTSCKNRTQMSDWYNTLDVFVTTSISEGTPNPPMEAMCCGRPVVTTGCGDMPELVYSGENGYITGTFHDQTSADRVVEKTCLFLKRLHENRELVKRFGNKAAEIMKSKRNWNTLAERWLDKIAGI